MSAKHPPEKVHVTVSYTGKNDFRETVPPSTTFGTIKITAMKDGFGLDPTAADQYVLQFENTDMADGQPVGSLDREDVKLRLMLKSEPHKG